MLIRVEGQLPRGCTAKDIVLAIIGKIGTAGGTGYTMEFAGSAIRDLTMEGRMTVCNMAIEAGARAAWWPWMTRRCEYVKGRPYYAPQGVEWDQAVAYWRSAAVFGRGRPLRQGGGTGAARASVRRSTWGTSPEMVVSIEDRRARSSRRKRTRTAATKAMERALEYMNLQPNVPMESIQIDKVFIGSCVRRQPHAEAALGIHLHAIGSAAVLPVEDEDAAAWLARCRPALRSKRHSLRAPPWVLLLLSAT